MPFVPNLQQLSILRALEYLGVQGCDSADSRRRATAPKIRFATGVPQVFLRACVLIDNEPFESAVVPMLSLDLVRREKSKAWPLLSRKHQFALRDGGIVELRWRRIKPIEMMDVLHESLGGRITPAKNSRKRAKTDESQDWNSVEAWVAIKTAHRSRALRVQSLHQEGFGPFMSITPRGLDLLDSFGEDDEPDALVRLSQIAPLTGLSKRTLDRYMRDKKLPVPDLRGGGGYAHKWYWSNIRTALAQFSKKRLPERFPGSRIQ
jgi:predicted DNA-binding transcriptional regulator AlpA